LYESKSYKIVGCHMMRQSRPSLTFSAIERQVALCNTFVANACGHCKVVVITARRPRGSVRYSKNRSNPQRVCDDSRAHFSLTRSDTTLPRRPMAQPHTAGLNRPPPPTTAHHLASASPLPRARDDPLPPLPPFIRATLASRPAAAGISVDEWHAFVASQ